MSGESLGIHAVPTGDVFPETVLFPCIPTGNMIAKIVSPIVSMVVVTLIGLAVRHYNQRRNSLRTNGKSSPLPPPPIVSALTGKARF